MLYSALSVVPVLLLIGLASGAAKSLEATITLLLIAATIVVPASLLMILDLFITLRVVRRLNAGAVSLRALLLLKS